MRRRHKAAATATESTTAARSATAVEPTTDIATACRVLPERTVGNRGNRQIRNAITAAAGQSAGCPMQGHEQTCRRKRLWQLTAWPLRLASSGMPAMAMNINGKMSLISCRNGSDPSD
jgi:hypothetical protein